MRTITGIIVTQQISLPVVLAAALLYWYSLSFEVLEYVSTLHRYKEVKKKMTGSGPALGSKS